MIFMCKLKLGNATIWGKCLFCSVKGAYCVVVRLIGFIWVQIVLRLLSLLGLFSVQRNFWIGCSFGSGVIFSNGVSIFLFSGRF